MAVVTPTEGQSGWASVLNAALTELDQAIIDQGLTVIDLSEVVSGKSDAAHTHLFSGFTDLVSLAQLPNGSMFVVRWVAAANGWQLNAQTWTTRPSNRTSLTMVAIGGTTAPTFALTGDMWFKEVV